MAQIGTYYVWIYSQYESDVKAKSDDIYMEAWPLIHTWLHRIAGKVRDLV